MKYKVGDKVRVRRDLEEYGQYGKYGANRNMAELHGSIVEIKKVENEEQRYEINDNLYYWTDEMFEGLAEEELTAEEAIKILGEICCESKLCCGCPISEAKGKMACQNFRRDKTEEVLEILKQWKKDHEKKEIETEIIDLIRVMKEENDSTTCIYAYEIDASKENIDEKIDELVKQYYEENGGKIYAKCERICRAKS